MKTGFSLVEILVSLAIVGIISSISVEGFFSSRERAMLDEDVSQVVQAIRKAQNEALAPSKSQTVGIDSIKQLCSIGVRITSSTKEIQPIYTSSTPPSTICNESNYSLSTKTLNYADIDADVTFNFDVPFAATTEKSITLTKGISKTIRVTSSGLIEVK
jgi:prepilin-type N-terminal cleavage/methylation domain-containing protein